jgi:hypothetical protein
MMDPAKKKHVTQNVKRVSDLQIRKYIAGQKEHGGKMWLKTGLLNAALEEVADLANYLPTIEYQVNQAIKLLKSKQPEKALTILEGLLSKKIEMPSN